MAETSPTASGSAPLRWALSFGGATHTGRRHGNEDAFACAPELGCAVIADGMGGLAHGERASRTVVDAVLRALASGQSVGEGFQQAHRALLRMRDEAQGQRLGSTAVVFALEPGGARVHWIGDSRLYRWRQGRIELLTRDHSYVTELLSAGAISAAEAETHPQRHVLMRALGASDGEAIHPESRALDLAPGDRLLLCSDGLSGYLDAADLADALGAPAGPGQIAAQLVERTLATGSADDNITAVCIRVEAGGDAG